LLNAINMGQLDKTLEFFKSPEGQERIKQFHEERRIKREIELNRFKKIDAWLENNSFDELMARLEKEHGDEWGDKCWKKGYEKYPNHKLALLIDYIRENREPVLIPWIDSDFLAEAIPFKGYVFATFCGQGCFHRIYKYDTQEVLFDC